MAREMLGSRKQYSYLTNRQHASKNYYENHVFTICDNNKPDSRGRRGSSESGDEKDGLKELSLSPKMKNELIDDDVSDSLNHYERLGSIAFGLVSDLQSSESVKLNSLPRYTNASDATVKVSKPRPVSQATLGESKDKFLPDLNADLFEVALSTSFYLPGE
eukprot:gene7161-12822_t